MVRLTKHALLFYPKKPLMPKKSVITTTTKEVAEAAVTPAANHFEPSGVLVRATDLEVALLILQDRLTINHWSSVALPRVEDIVHD